MLTTSTPDEALHASAPKGYKCADCTLETEPCPDCYSVWWDNRHPPQHWNPLAFRVQNFYRPDEQPKFAFALPVEEDQ